MVRLPEDKDTTQYRIDNFEVQDSHRPYLGMSMIGDPCARKLFYTFRWAYPKILSGKQQRIFNFGHLAEEQIIKALNSIGIKTYLIDNENEIPLTGHIDETQEEIIGFMEHAKGHFDGRCIGVIEAPKTEHLLEIKTHNDKSFKGVRKEGVKISKPEHYAQIQRYMKGTKLTRALYVAYNKNDSDIYIERIKYDKNHAELLATKEQDIILSDTPPTKEFSPSWWACRFCDARDICHYNEKVELNCRTCEHVNIGSKGKWLCTKQDNKLLSIAEQRKGCTMYQVGF